LGAAAVLGVDVGALPEPAAAVREFAGLTAPEGLRIRRDQVGDGYAKLTAPTAEALTLAARTAGLVLDPTYTGRAMAGLIAAVRDGDIRPGERTVFVHTGGLPGLFGHGEAVAYAEGQVVAYQE
ncbi:pyridoxal-phosphate dependent enzyme, partial [Streptomyces sp. W16]|nr:pyridoxal-phosphate dependent enzyme [Streptomyces sp. W16]